MFSAAQCLCRRKHLPVAIRLPALAGSGFLRMGPFSSPCVSSPSHLGLPLEVLLSCMSGLLPFFLVLNCFHWFNFVEKLVFPEVPILILHVGSRSIFIETFFEFFDPALRILWTALSSFYSTALASVELP
jgi:hypothetical protein